jgi:hypothetical protein
MTDLDPRLKEQLSAWLDGELPADEARFLQRRLDNDPALRAQFERWQLASACLRGQPVRRMPAGFAERVQAGLGPAAPVRARWPWVASAAAAVLMVALLPNMLATDGNRGLPASGDLASAPVPAPALPELAPAPVAPSSPLPSVRDFPLASHVGGKPWPRSPVVAGDRSLQAYLVRHNAMAAGDGVGGFLPYVDVVTQEADAGRPATAPEDRRP